MNKNIYLVIFIIVILILINKSQRDQFTNFCESYEKNGEHCPYRIKYRDGIKKPISNDLTINNALSDWGCDCNKTSQTTPNPTSTSNDTSNEDVPMPSCTQKPDFLMFAGKYPVGIKTKNNTNLCGK